MRGPIKITRIFFIILFILNNDHSFGGLNIPLNSPNLEYKSHQVKNLITQHYWVWVWPGIQTNIIRFAWNLLVVFSTSSTTTRHASNRWARSLLLAALIIRAWAVTSARPYWICLWIWTYPKTHQIEIYVTSGENCYTAISLAVGVARGLYRAPWNISNLTYINQIRYAYVSWPHEQKTSTDPYPQSNRKSAFCPHFSMLRTLTNSYRFNTTDFTFSQYHPQTVVKCI